MKPGVKASGFFVPCLSQLTQYTMRTSLINVLVFSIAIPMIFSSGCIQKELSEEERIELANEICENKLILDSHIDWPESVYNTPRNIAEENEIGDFDLVRARKGGLNAVLSVLYIDPDLDVEEGRVVFDSLYNIVGTYLMGYPNRFAGAINPDDIRRNFKNKLLSTPVCLENGSIIGAQLEYIKHLKDLGIVYITLNHNKSNQISDANVDSNRPWDGLSPFGEKVIDEMNRQGIIIDISHSSDNTVNQVLEISKAPIIATHSSCRHFTPDYERNLSDELIEKIADKEGIVMIALGSFFLDSICCKNTNYLLNYLDSIGVSYKDPEGMNFIQSFMQNNKMRAESHQVVDHIDHVVEIAGIDHVGIGSDYDGIGPSQPIGLPDVSSYPVVVNELLKRGYSEKEIEKILSKNFFRVWDEVVEVANGMN
ncbi:MAG: dipeptidase [Bacteroidota bacterium]